MSSTTPDVSARIAGLFVYPVKSCGGVALTQALLTETGLDLDRAWMVVDAQGAFVTQRELPRMALVRPLLKHYELVLRAPGMLALHITIDAVERAVKARVWDDEVEAFDMGDVAAQWFSDFLGRKLRLVRFNPDHRRLSELRWTGGLEAPNQFSDGFPLLVIGEASVQELNRRLAAANHAAVGIERFRPNIVLSGLQANDEDQLDILHINDAGDKPLRLRLVKPCSRCTIANIDPGSAEIHSYVGDTLQVYRKNERLDGAVTFGMNAIVLEDAEALLRLGQEIGAKWRFD